MAMMKSEWVSILKPDPKAKIRLFCLPDAGASAAAFRHWPNILAPAGIQVCAIQLPGRGARLKEAPITRTQTLIEELASALQAYLDKPFAIFGPGLGALIGFELARYLRQEPETYLKHLVVAGRRAPQISKDGAASYQLSDPELLNVLKNSTDTPAEVFEHPELMQIMLPILRADLELDETYVYRDGPPLDIPISAYGGFEDMSVSKKELDAWKQQTTASFRIEIFPGDHFFLHSSESRLLITMKRELAAS